MDDEETIVDAPEPESGVKRKKPKKPDPVAKSFYGDEFDGYMRVAELTPYLPAFKELWYQTKIKDPNVGVTAIIRAFNVTIAPEKFHPYPGQLRVWTTKWKRDLAQQAASREEGLEIMPSKDVRQVIATRSRAPGLYATPDDNSLEAGVRTLGGELLNDALQMLKDDQDLEEMIDGEELVKRRAYIVNVFAQVTKMTHGKATLMLKASEEKRNNASFLMDLLKRAASGEIKPEELALLKSTPTPVVVEESAPVPVTV